MKGRPLVFVACGILIACNRSVEEPGGSAAVRSTATATAAASAHRVLPPGAIPPGTLALDPPASWKRAQNPSPMRKATYIIAHAPSDSEDAELSISQAGGTVEQNVSRWAGQFDQKLSDAKTREKTIGGLKVTFVEMHGDYTGMAAPGAPDRASKKKSWALLGAIIDTKPPHFLKLTGPAATVMSAREEFDQFVGTAHLTGAPATVAPATATPAPASPAPPPAP